MATPRRKRRHSVGNIGIGNTTYVMEDGGGLENLEAIVKEKDLGVHVTRDLKSEEHYAVS